MRARMTCAANRAEGIASECPGPDGEPFAPGQNKAQHVLDLGHISSRPNFR